MAGLADLFGLSGGGMFGGSGGGGMFGPQTMGLLRQFLAGRGNDARGQRGMPQAEMPPLPPPIGGFMPGIEGEGLTRDPWAQTFPEQYNATPGRIPGTLNQNILQDWTVPGTMDNMLQGLPPELLRMLLAPRQI